jgi:hypothetical protein
VRGCSRFRFVLPISVLRGEERIDATFTDLMRPMQMREADDDGDRGMVEVGMW